MAALDDPDRTGVAGDLAVHVENVRAPRESGR
jgi:hypothetical protein